MGYKVKVNTITLKFADEEFDGLEVETKKISINQYMRLLALDEVKEESAETVEEMLSIFAACLVKWNLEDDKGKTVPTTLKGVKDQDLEFIMTVIGTWIQNIAGTPGPLGENSNSTSNSQVELTLPMETL